MFDGGDPASASAMSDTEVLFISRGDVRALCLERPEVALKILQVVAARQRRVVAVIEELSFTTVQSTTGLVAAPAGGVQRATV